MQCLRDLQQAERRQQTTYKMLEAEAVGHTGKHCANHDLYNHIIYSFFEIIYTLKFLIALIFE